MPNNAPTLALLGSYREFPIPRHLIPATLLLIDLEYTAPAIDAVLTHLNRYGSAEGCPWIDREHRAMVEKTLPYDPAFNDPSWSADVWNAIDDDDNGPSDGSPVGSPELVGAVA